MAEAKKDVVISTIEELEVIAERCIASGRTDIKLHLDPTLLADDRAWAILEKISKDHPKSQPQPGASDGEAHPEAETEAQAPSEAEVVTYCESHTKEHRSIPYKVTATGDGYRVHVHQGCAGWMEPWDCPFSTPEDADAHGVSYIDGIIAQAEEAAAQIKRNKNEPRP